MKTLFDSRPKAIAASLMVLCPLCFIAAIPWLKSQSEATVHLLGGLAASGTVVASFVLAVLKDQELDEWHRSAARFSNQWGWLAGGGVIAVLQGVPAFQALVIELSAVGSEAAGKQPLFAFMLGFMSVILAQMACTIALSKGWRSWMSRDAA
jgi:hypothetical protein